MADTEIVPEPEGDEPVSSTDPESVPGPEAEESDPTTRVEEPTRLYASPELEFAKDEASAGDSPAQRLGKYTIQERIG